MKGLDQDKIENMQKDIDYLNEEIKKINDHNDYQLSAFSKQNEINSSVTEILNNIKNLIQGEMKKIDSLSLSTENKPHACPVCRGRKVHNHQICQLGQLITIQDNCVACDATGIVWG